jgi:hypothetical protein
VQLLRIQLRVPEYGWTTQKVFHLLNCLVCCLRAGTFVCRQQMQTLHPDALRLVLFDLPGAGPLKLQPARSARAAAASCSWRWWRRCAALRACRRVA